MLAAMTTFAPGTQQPAAADGAPLRIPASVSAPSPTREPFAAPARGRLAALLDGLRRRSPVDPARDAVYRHDEGGAGDDGGWD